MGKIDIKTIGAAIFLCIVAIISFVYWKDTSDLIMKTIESKVLTFIIWMLIIVTSAIHLYVNNSDDKNLISDKDGLDKPIDYIQFILTFGAIGTSIQILIKEIFAKYNFPEKALCINFNGFDYAAFFIVIVVLIFYCHSKIKPVIQETYIKKEKVRPSDDSLNFDEKSNHTE